MIDFREIQIEDKTWADALIKKAGMSGSHNNFSTMFTWAYINSCVIAKVDDFLVVKLKIKDKEDSMFGYFFPIGGRDAKPVIDRMIQDARARNHPFCMFGLTKENVEALEAFYPGQLVFECDPDTFDYVYELDRLVSLSGKKLHAKRNHINAFNKRYEGWRFEVLSDDNFEECKEMNRLWCIEANCAEEHGLLVEHCATRRYFKYMKELGVEGGLIRADGRVVAFTIGEVLNNDTYVIHIEKAFRDIQGGYTIINREFAAWVKEKYPNMVWMNREEDMGQEGLRKAKRSYYPDMMVEKCRAGFKDD